jgi:CelD/BcsL family acetyltransferase involved in cellulose biosynthesis
MSVRVLTTEGEFEALESAWDEVFRAGRDNTPYQSWSWNFTWWKYFGTPGLLRLIVIEADGRLLGIAPLFLARRFRGLPLRHLSFLSPKRADYLDFVVRPGSEPVFFTELMEYLRDGTREWQFVELRDLRDSSPNVPHLLNAISHTLPLLTQSADEGCVTVPLEASWEAYASGLSKRFRKDIAYYRRSFEKKFATELRIATSPPEVFTVLADLISVYRTRWREKRGATQFDDRRAASFEREICERFSVAGCYRLYVLYADSRPVAGILSYVLNQRCHVELFAHSPEFHKFSVGTVLLSMAIEDAIAHGWTELDLMRGDEAYKYRWNGRAKRNYKIRLFRDRTRLQLISSIEWLFLRAASVGALQRLRARYRGLQTQRNGTPAEQQDG